MRIWSNEFVVFFESSETSFFCDHSYLVIKDFFKGHLQHCKKVTVVQLWVISSSVLCINCCLVEHIAGIAAERKKYSNKRQLIVKPWVQHQVNTVCKIQYLSFNIYVNQEKVKMLPILMFLLPRGLNEFNIRPKSGNTMPQHILLTFQIKNSSFPQGLC